MATSSSRCVIGILAVIGLVAFSDSAGAQSACQANFSESGQWSSGKSFRTHLDTSDTTFDQAFRAAAQAIAAEGFLGLTTNKDVGIVSAYQEDNGKKSTITATVSETDSGAIRVEATFSLARGLRSPIGAVREYLCKIVEACVPEGAGSRSSGMSLSSGGDELSLISTVGEFRKAGVGPVMLLFFDFEGSEAEVRSTDRRPSVLIQADSDPASSFLWVRCETDSKGGRRSIKVGSAGSLLRASVTGEADLAPDEDWTLPFSSTLEEPGVWRLTPTTDLAPGEYGLWDVEGLGVALFGVDGSE